MVFPRSLQPMGAANYLWITRKVIPVISLSPQAVYSQLQCVSMGCQYCAMWVKSTVTNDLRAIFKVTF